MLHFLWFCQDLHFVDSLSKQIFNACWTFIDLWNQRVCFEVQFTFSLLPPWDDQAIRAGIIFVWNRARGRTGWFWLASALSAQSADALKIPLMHEDTWMKYPNPGMPSLWLTIFCSHTIKASISEQYIGIRKYTQFHFIHLILQLISHLVSLAQGGVIVVSSLGVVLVLGIHQIL